jgi:hypothetical protein
MAFVARRIGGLANRFATALTSPIGLITAGTIGATTIASVSYYADSKDFFVYKFRTTKDPDAVVDFYSTEDFLEILGIFPFAIRFVLAGVTWDDKKEQTMNVWESMQISFDITEKEEIIDGKEVVTFFNKREVRASPSSLRPLTRAATAQAVPTRRAAPLPHGYAVAAHRVRSRTEQLPGWPRLTRAPALVRSASSTTSRPRASSFGTRCRTTATVGCRTAASRCRTRVSPSTVHGPCA